MHINPRGEEEDMTSLTTEPQNGYSRNTDPATIFVIGISYILYTENREWQGTYLGRYQTESEDWIIQIRDIEENNQEIVAKAVISWKKTQTH